MDAAAANSSASFRPLNVKDALSYLDRVKQQFSTQHEVYDLFLNIMKDFKTQSIDTPGVIDRVSSLFRAHPALIQGFNTFLPPGYTIQCQVTADKNTITVTTPSGVTTRVQDLTPAPAIVPTPAPPAPTPPAPVSQVVPPPPVVPLPEKDQTPVMEFNHAINYVNKIKNRFTQDPETYKTFLEILQTYQKETRPIQEVYTQVTALFHDAPDLLDEFKAFLPDTTDSATQLQQSTLPPKKKTNPPPANRDAPAQVKQKTMVEEKKKRAAPGMGERAKAKRAKTNHTLLESPPAAHMGKPKQDRYQNLESMQPSIYQNPNAAQMYGASPLGFPGAPRMQSAYDSYLSNHKTPNLVEAHEFNFFDKVKKYLDDRSTYTEFLKLLNLFTQEIIDINTLLEKSLLFIGGSDDLVGNFKELVGWDFVKDGRIKGEDWIIDNEPVLDRPKVELHLMKSFGPSYRKLPDSEIDLACSGRDSLEWSVLNDEWVAFATSASEGSGAHRKNVYEDALYNSEQERHWYSFQIESNLRTIAHFEPLVARIVRMNSVDRVNFRLEDNFGGDSPSIYKRVIKKVYGKDQGNEILQALYDNPCVAIPIVLARLKQKDEEWKRALREWNKVWREVDAKNFYRALDHQGVSFKALDKKATMTVKMLANEIENLKADSEQKRFDVADDNVPTTRPLHQFEFNFSNHQVLYDVLKLIFSFIDRDHNSPFSTREKNKLEKFIRNFIPAMFELDQVEFDSHLPPHENGISLDDVDDEEEETVREEEVESELEASDDEPRDKRSVSTSSSGGMTRKGAAADLRKKLLSHSTGTVKSSARKPQSPKNLEANLNEQTWIQLTARTAIEEEDGLVQEPTINFFTNSSFYCLLRLIQTLYTRLGAFKALSTKLAQHKKIQRLSKTAVKLGLVTPVPFIDDYTEDLDEAGENGGHRSYYEHALDLSEKLFDGEIDQPTFEEHLRYMVGIYAYPLFTVDKIIATLIKHIHTINGDNRCQELLSMFEKDRIREDLSPQRQIAYRMEAETLIGPDETLYRVERLPKLKSMTIQLLNKEDLTLDDSYASESKMLKSWIASYSLTSPTEGIGAHVDAPLLSRNRNLEEEVIEDGDFDIVNRMEAKVVNETYKLLFVANTEDYLHRKRMEFDTSLTSKGKKVQSIPILAPPAQILAQKRQQRFDNWLEREVAERNAVEVGMEMDL